VQTDPSSSAARIRFGDFEVDVRSHELWRLGRRVRLQEKSFLVLQKLLESPGRVVTREELAAALWPQQQFVDAEHGLNTAVRRLREALGDSADEPRFVETLPKLGYRFIGAIAEGGVQQAPAAASGQPSASAAPPQGGYQPLLLAAIGVVVVAGLVVFAARAPRSAGPGATQGASAAPVLPPNADEVGELIARGRFLRNTKRIAEAQQFFQQAVKLDPKNANAVAGVALGYLAERKVELARETAQRALELDPNAADALRTLGNIALSANDYAGAERYYKRAIAAEPGYSKSHNRLARLLLQTGRFDEARQQMLESRRLDPNDPDVQNIWMDYWFRTGDYESAIREGERWLAIWPDLGGKVSDWVRVLLGYSYIGARRLDDALAHFRALDPGDELSPALALAYLGRTAEARAILDRRELAIAATDHSTPFDPELDGAMAMTYVVMGDLDRAFEHLDRQIAAGVYPSWLNAAMFQPLRRDPRWPELAERLQREFLSGKQWPVQDDNAHRIEGFAARTPEARKAN
jgi:tetratricopeptide (TPR) repeat protein